MGGGVGPRGDPPAIKCQWIFLPRDPTPSQLLKIPTRHIFAFLTLTRWCITAKDDADAYCLALVPVFSFLSWKKRTDSLKTLFILYIYYVQFILYSTHSWYQRRVFFCVGICPVFQYDTTSCMVRSQIDQITRFGTRRAVWSALQKASSRSA